MDQNSMFFFKRLCLLMNFMNQLLEPLNPSTLLNFLASRRISNSSSSSKFLIFSHRINSIQMSVGRPPPSFRMHPFFRHLSRFLLGISYFFDTYFTSYPLLILVMEMDTSSTAASFSSSEYFLYGPRIMALFSRRASDSSSSSKEIEAQSLKGKSDKLLPVLYLLKMQYQEQSGWNSPEIVMSDLACPQYFSILIYWEQKTAIFKNVPNSKNQNPSHKNPPFTNLSKGDFQFYHPSHSNLSEIFHQHPKSKIYIQMPHPTKQKFNPNYIQSILINSQNLNLLGFPAIQTLSFKNPVNRLLDPSVRQGKNQFDKL